MPGAECVPYMWSCPCCSRLTKLHCDHLVLSLPLPPDREQPEDGGQVQLTPASPVLSAKHTISPAESFAEAIG